MSDEKASSLPRNKQSKRRAMSCIARSAPFMPAAKSRYYRTLPVGMTPTRLAAMVTTRHTSRALSPADVTNEELVLASCDASVEGEPSVGRPWRVEHTHDGIVMVKPSRLAADNAASSLDHRTSTAWLPTITISSSSAMVATARSTCSSCSRVTVFAQIAVSRQR